MPRSPKKPEKISPAMAKTTKQSLQAKRLKLLIEQLLPSCDGNKRAVAARLHIDASVPSKFVAEPSRGIDSGVIERLLEGFEPRPGHELDPAWFSTHLTDPHYLDFVRPKQTKKTDAPKAKLPREAEAMLEALGATLPEREMFDDHLKLFPYPFLNGEHVKAFIVGLRKGLSLLKATDAAVTAAVAEERRRVEKRDA